VFAFLLQTGLAQCQELNGFWRAIVSKVMFPDSIYRVEEYYFSENKFELRTSFKRYSYTSGLAQYDINTDSGDFKIDSSRLIEDGRPTIHYQWDFNKIWMSASPHHTEYVFSVNGDTLIIVRQTGNPGIMFRRISDGPQWSIDKIQMPTTVLSNKIKAIPRARPRVDGLGRLWKIGIAGNRHSNSGSQPKLFFLGE
jgi:hypothetical protein